ncbi:MAM and LDL-receptor class A domain-containing protein 1-like [Dreissena polymorpha]|uniref:MAM and LDL-receptor class A domain-containing protein 1-like n=1 Tax=Dreissena polymorpha TaxID=45954 RepID=UPI002263D18B|nr:MAM and LDL-receptor class A domain-containing protein 1-like [Dreissena polymorpha]
MTMMRFSLAYVQVRLVGSSFGNQGRVEVLYGASWGTVCDDSWDHADAMVVCRQLGQGAIAVDVAKFGQGNGLILLDDLTCTGTESSIDQCDRQCSVNNGLCAHNCVSEDGFGGKCTCHQGYRLDSNLYTCSEIDKCADGRSGCEHNCTNFNGSYVCSCMPGFSLETDKHSCNVNPCTFDNYTTCMWKDVSSGDEFDWTLGNGETPSPGTGPSGDHTLRNAEGKYLYIETSGSRQTGDRALLVSPLLFPLSHMERCLQLWYSMNGPTIGYLRVYMSLDDVTPGTLLWAMSGDQGPDWKVAYIPLVSQQQYKIIIGAVVGPSYFGDIAIDDLQIFPSRCEHIQSLIVG